MRFERTSAFVEVSGDRGKRQGPLPLCGCGEPGPGGLEAFRTALLSPVPGFHGSRQRTTYTLVNDGHLAREDVKMRQIFGTHK